MKRVEFERVTSDIWGVGLIKGSRYVFHDVEKLIEARLLDGWEYCGWVPVENWSDSAKAAISLIFQKEE